MRKILIQIVIVITLLLSFTTTNANGQQAEPPFLKYLNHPWVDSVFNNLSEDEKIAQSIWVAAWSNKDISHYTGISDMIRNKKIGGLIFFQGTAEKQSELINHYQNISKVPLSIAIDAEWGPGMRLDNIADFPYQMTLGAISDDSLIYRMGLEIGRELSLLGINYNLAPVADINNNPANPVINYRSFGENRENVAKKVMMYAAGLQNSRIIATAKHFPGHGDTDTDSHLDLPVISHSTERFDSLELYPFIHLINSGIGSVMPAHLNIPSLDTTPNLPSSLSKPIVTGLLKEKLGFNGLIITDAMNMKGVTKYYGPGEADAKAYIAGNDVLEFVNDVDAAINGIKGALINGSVTSEEVELKCRKILAMKLWCGLDNFAPIACNGIDSKVTTPGTKALIHDLYTGALTLLNNRSNIIPVKHLEKKKIAVLAMNNSRTTPFQEMVSNYTNISKYYWKPGLTNESELLDSLAKYDIVIAGISGTDQRPQKNFGVTTEMRIFFKKLIGQNSVISSYFGNPYAIQLFPELGSSDGLIITYQDNRNTQELSAQLIFGGIGAHGKLPVTINPDYPEGYGLISPGNIRLRYAYPENAGISSELISQKIDSIVFAGLKAGAFPGCEVIVARKGIVVFHKTYGYHTFYNRQRVEPGDLYDLASVTKASGPTAALMLLDDMGLFDPDNTLSTYWSKTDRVKSDISMREILAHQAGLAAWIPYWKNTVKPNGKFKPRTIKYQYSEKYPLKVANGLYLHHKYINKIYREIKRSPVGEKKYLYSGLSFFLYPEIITNLSGSGYELFLKENIYHKLGAYSITFNPYRYYPLVNIVPSENDDLFRNQQLHGYVHDEGAAMMGGFSGNAGLFATANDLLKLYEMYRRYGRYGDKQIISEETLRDYSSYQFPENDNRRGLGFDKPQLRDSINDIRHIYPCQGASPSSFGHSGYTGTFAWADPEKEISYIFLSNRVYPTRSNNKISDMNIRTDILQGIYDSIIN